MTKKSGLLQLFFIILFIACGSIRLPAQNGNSMPPGFNKQKHQQQMKAITAANIKKAAAIQFQYFVTKAASSSYGYSIFANGNLYIQQNTIPAMGGTKGFADTTSAGKVARLAIKKIKLGMLPPTITISDLKNLGIQ
jgi:hypothetical protein